jgi:hypothetical protein
MVTGWLTRILQVFAPAFTLSLCDNEYARNPPAPIAFVVMAYSKKGKRRTQLLKNL